jgi:hypothetical protein
LQVCPHLPLLHAPPVFALCMVQALAWLSHRSRSPSSCPRPRMSVFPCMSAGVPGCARNTRRGGPLQAVQALLSHGDACSLFPKEEMMLALAESQAATLSAAAADGGGVGVGYHLDAGFDDGRRVSSSTISPPQRAAVAAAGQLGAGRGGASAAGPGGPSGLSATLGARRPMPFNHQDLQLPLRPGAAFVRGPPHCTALLAACRSLTPNRRTCLARACKPPACLPSPHPLSLSLSLIRHCCSGGRPGQRQRAGPASLCCRGGHAGCHRCRPQRELRLPHGVPLAQPARRPRCCIPAAALPAATLAPPRRRGRRWRRQQRRLLQA